MSAIIIASAQTKFAESAFEFIAFTVYGDTRRKTNTISRKSDACTNSGCQALLSSRALIRGWARGYMYGPTCILLGLVAM